ncbi:MAG: hypothetical protein OXP66_07830 [Candidatus Tectomicrobia bacterium]|nr:hypothetical protein [Candidatus Tectomicrobia bacterium]
MDWKIVGAVAGTVTLPFLAVLVAMVSMFNQVNARLDAMNGRIDTLQMETHRRFDAVHTEMNRRFDAMQTEMNRRFDLMQTEMNRRFDLMQAENQRQHDVMQSENQRQHGEIKDVLRVFEGRITRLEENAGIGPENSD